MSAAERIEKAREALIEAAEALESEARNYPGVAYQAHSKTLLAKATQARRAASHALAAPPAQPVVVDRAGRCFTCDGPVPCAGPVCRAALAGGAE